MLSLLLDWQRRQLGEWSQNNCKDLYLDLMRLSLANAIYGDPNMLFGRPLVYDPKLRAEGLDWPSRAHTMVGMKRLANVQFCVEDVLARGVPGDLMETGVWRGGVVILMRAILKAYGISDRHVWVADSFQGLPPPDVANYPPDAGSNLHEFAELVVSLEEVQENFRRYGLLDQQVRFLKGWFRDTLPAAPIDRLAVLRLDGDLYESTMDALKNLYPKLQVGGYLIVDDFSDVPPCRQAVLDYRAQHGLTEPIVPVDWTGVFWQKQQNL